jgi:hypothetical protein
VSRRTNEQRRRRVHRKWLEREADECRERLALLEAKLHEEWRQQEAASSLTADPGTDSSELIPPEVL